MKKKKNLCYDQQPICRILIHFCDALLRKMHPVVSFKKAHVLHFIVNVHK